MQSYNNNRNKYRICLLIILFCIGVWGFSSCKKFILADGPTTSINGENVYNNDITAAAVLTGIYTRMSTPDFGGGRGLLRYMCYYPGLSADELTLHSSVTETTDLALYKNALSAASPGADLWSFFYSSVIYPSNAAIAGIAKSTELTPVIHDQLLGEAYFMRAFSYFYLVNLYGEVPLLLTTEYASNALLAKVSTDQVYQQITADLLAAQALLSVGYVDGSIIKPTSERVRPNKGAATALLARVYLYRKAYADAETQATSVLTTILDGKLLYDTVPLASVFKKNSLETIWSLQAIGITTSQNTPEGKFFILPSTGFSKENSTYLSMNLMSSFEGGDQRKAVWTRSAVLSGISYPYAFKYTIGLEDKPTQEYSMLLRLGEIYLIRAEARAQQGKLTAADDLNVVRRRAGLPNTTASSPAGLVDAIAHERQVELFTEIGHRWLDLKRTGKVNAVMSIITPQKGGSWDSRWALYPIPESETDKDPNLKQNPGYE